MARQKGPRKLDIGYKSGRLVVIGFDEDYVKPDGRKIYKYKCKCSCGNETSVREDALISKKTQSCGCIHDEIFINRNTKHGIGCSSLYKEYHSMVRRCNKPNSTQIRYAELGIYVCDEWLNDGPDDYSGLMNFYNWSMENGYKEGLTLDRIDNDGPYAPWNCRWVPQIIQANNKSTNKFIEYEGTTYTYAQWERAYGFSTGLITSNIKKYSFGEIIEKYKKDHLINAIHFVDEYDNPICENNNDKE